MRMQSAQQSVAVWGHALKRPAAFVAFCLVAPGYVLSRMVPHEGSFRKYLGERSYFDPDFAALVAASDVSLERGLLTASARLSGPAAGKAAPAGRDKAWDMHFTGFCTSIFVERTA
jgi:hypothetical protein